MALCISTECFCALCQIFGWLKKTVSSTNRNVSLFQSYAELSKDGVKGC